MNMKNYHRSRRDFIALCIGGGLLVTGYPLMKVITKAGDGKNKEPFIPTPSNSLGPYYKKGAPRREKLIEASDAGVPLLVAGQVINTDGKPLTDAVIEVFHADHQGSYDMEGFRYRGEIPASASGEYRFETIIPGHYGGRAKHIHYMINAPGHRRLVTQLYFESDPVFEGNPDKTYTKDSLVEHRELIRPVTVMSKDNSSYSSVVFNICMEKA
jgi:protocatechuate 3,4-dioxygenase beta subunit